jgi:hypothetical protein
MPRAASAAHTATSWQYLRCIRSVSEASRLLATIMLPMMAASAMRLSVRVGMARYLVDEMEGKLEMLCRFFGFVSATKKPQMGQWGNDVSALLAEDESRPHCQTSRSSLSRFMSASRWSISRRS